MSLPGRTELILTTLITDLLKETELRTGTILGNVRKSSKFKLKSVEHTTFFVAVWDLLANDNEINRFQNRFSKFKITFFN